jgi:hypothetical protein
MALYNNMPCARSCKSYLLEVQGYLRWIMGNILVKYDRYMCESNLILSLA